MSDLFVFAMGCFISLLCAAFVVLSHLELKRLTQNAARRAEGSRNPLATSPNPSRTGS